MYRIPNESLKDAMFKSAKDGSYRFSDFDFDPNQTTLIDYGQEATWISKAADEVTKMLETTFRKGEIVPIYLVKKRIICKTKWKYQSEILKHKHGARSCPFWVN